MTATFRGLFLLLVYVLRFRAKLLAASGQFFVFARANCSASAESSCSINFKNSVPD